MIAANGHAAFFSGSKIISIAKGRIGRDCVGVGNILRTTEVVDAMVERFEAGAAEPLTDRLVSAIEDGLAAGKAAPSLQRTLWARLLAALRPCG